MVAERSPDLPADEQRRARPHDRHRRGEVRRPVAPTASRTTCSTGTACSSFEGNTAPVPAVRARPHLQHLPPGRRRPRRRCAASCPRSASRRSGRSRCSCCSSTPPCTTRSSKFSPHRLCTYLFELAQTFTVVLRGLPGAEGRDRGDSRRAGSRCATSPRACCSRAWRCWASTPPSGCDVNPVLHVACCPTPRRSPADGSLAIGGCSRRRARRRSTARRCSSTTRRTCAPAAARPSTRSAPAAPCTPPRRSCAGRWPGSRTRRACCSTSPAAASCSSPCTPACRPIGAHAARQQQEPRRAAHGDHRGRAPHRRRQLRRARPARRAARRGAARARTCCCASPPACTPTPTSSSPPGRTTASSASTWATATRTVPSSACVARRRCTWSACTATSARNVFEASSFAKAAEVMAAFADAARPARAGARRRPRRGLRGGRGGADDHPVGQRAARRLPGARRAQRGQRRARAQHRRRRRRSPSTRWARSSTSPASAPTSSVDGGMSDNPRPVLYGSGYEAFLPRAVARRSARQRARLVGKHCESGDVLIFDAALPEDVRVGDLLATPVTGAYGHSMASNYNKLTRPPVVFVARRRAPARGAARDLRGPGALRRGLTWHAARSSSARADRKLFGGGRTGRPSKRARRPVRRRGRRTDVRDATTVRVRAASSTATPTRARWCGPGCRTRTTRRQGKDRPVVIIGRRGRHLLGVALTSKDRATAQCQRAGRYRAVGSRGRAPATRRSTGCSTSIPAQVRREGADPRPSAPRRSRRRPCVACTNAAADQPWSAAQTVSRPGLSNS